MYSSPEAVFDAIGKDVRDLRDSGIAKGVSSAHLVNAVLISACCDTCGHYNKVAKTCLEHGCNIEHPERICREGRYSCNPTAVNAIVAERQESFEP
jgi:hypothetical protein